MRNTLRHAFTMIELIFVIIILGILAATALPRFVGMQDDAKVSAEKGTVGGVRGGIAMSHSKWLLQQGATNDWDGDGVEEHFFTSSEAGTTASGGYLEDLDDGDAYDNTAATTNGVFAEILTDPAENWVRTTGGDGTSTSVYEGPASHSTSGLANSGTNDLNTTGSWTYDGYTGRFTYQ